jgi:hypothetical protein
VAIGRSCGGLFVPADNTRSARSFSAALGPTVTTRLLAIPARAHTAPAATPAPRGIQEQPAASSACSDPVGRQREQGMDRQQRQDRGNRSRCRPVHGEAIECGVGLWNMPRTHADSSPLEERAERFHRHCLSMGCRVEHHPRMFPNSLNLGHEITRRCRHHRRHPFEQTRGRAPGEDIRGRLQQLVVLNRVRPIEDSVREVQDRVAADELRILPGWPSPGDIGDNH